MARLIGQVDRFALPLPSLRVWGALFKLIHQQVTTLLLVTLLINQAASGSIHDSGVSLQNPHRVLILAAMLMHGRRNPTPCAHVRSAFLEAVKTNPCGCFHQFPSYANKVPDIM